MKMLTSKHSGLPAFDNYKEEGPCDDGYETLQDFFLSWTLRCAADDFREVNPKLQEYARRMVFFLIHGKNDAGKFVYRNSPPQTFIVHEVTTRRQRGRIDLIVGVTYEIDTIRAVCVLSIENKWYSTLGYSQLENYREYIELSYPSLQHVHLFITCDDSRKHYEQEKEICVQNGYKYLTISDMAGYAGIYDEGSVTGNALFDEYWQNS